MRSALDPQARELLLMLWRGAPAGCYWTKHGKRSQWTRTTAPEPCELGDRDVYFSVHPLAGLRSERERGRIGDVAAANCLYSEYDSKDARFAGDPARVRAHILSLPLQPQVIVYSGGGCHCYWILSEPIHVDESVRTYLRGVQRSWVKATGGDPGAADLARVLRLPGTLNSKYTPARRVSFARFNLGDLYNLNTLFRLAEEYFDDQVPDDRAQGEAKCELSDMRGGTDCRGADQGGDSVITLYNARMPVVDLLRHYGYAVSADCRHFTRPGKSPRDGASGTIDLARNQAYTFSSSDPGFDAGDTSPSGAGCTLRPFDLLARLSFNGDAGAAVKHLHEATR
jgi:hypothetical protein